MQYRKSLRLPHYDYSQAGAYFITICTYQRVCLFGDIVDGAIKLNESGLLVKAVWDELPAHYANVSLDSFVVMPNHAHGIIVINEEGFRPTSKNMEGQHDNVGAGLRPAPTTQYGLPEIVRALKTFSARKINQRRDMQGTPLWQRNYYEHVIRDEEDLAGVREYIVNNPLQWHLDEENPIWGVGAGFKPAPTVDDD